MLQVMLQSNAVFAVYPAAILLTELRAPCDALHIRRTRSALPTCEGVMLVCRAEHGVSSTIRDLCFSPAHKDKVRGFAHLPGNPCPARSQHVLRGVQGPFHHGCLNRDYNLYTCCGASQHGGTFCFQVLAAVADNGTCSLWAWEQRLQITTLDLPKGTDLSPGEMPSASYFLLDLHVVCGSSR